MSAIPGTGTGTGTGSPGHGARAARVEHADTELHSHPHRWRRWPYATHHKDIGPAPFHTVETPPLAK